MYETAAHLHPLIHFCISSHVGAMHRKIGRIVFKRGLQASPEKKKMKPKWAWPFSLGTVV